MPPQRVRHPRQNKPAAPHALRIIGRMIRTLLFSTLYPSSVRPSHGIFGEYAKHAAVPTYEERNGIHFEHP